MPDGSLLHGLFVVVYLVVLVGVGAKKARSIKSQEDFALAGRGLSPFILVGTLLATWIGTGSILGNAEETYGVGLTAMLLPTASLTGILALFVLAPRIRRFGQFTIQDILEARFGAAARLAGTVTLVLAYVIIVSYQYRAGAAVLGYVWPSLEGTSLAVGLVALFVVVYTALAGMYSVAYTDVANGVLMTIGILIALPLLFGEVGGVTGVQKALTEPELDLFRYTPWELVSVLLPTLLLILGDANMYQRFFSAKTPQAARTSAAGMFFGVLILELAIISVALIGKALVQSEQLAPPTNDAYIVLHLAFEVLPTWLGALLVGTVVAIIVSTADSFLLAPATSVVRDVYARFIAPDADELTLVRAGRWAVVGLGVIAFGLAFTSDEFFDVALFAYTIYGAGITPVILAAFFWKRATPSGALASMGTGAATAIAWYVGIERGALQNFEPLSELATDLADAGIDAVLPSMVVSLVALVVVSLAGDPPPPERTDVL